MAVTLKMDRGDRRTLQIPITRTGEDPAGDLQFRIGDDSDWMLVSPVDPDENPAVYEILIAYGAVDDFPNEHPTETVEITRQVLIRTRPPTGRDIDVQTVAWIRPS